MNTGKYPVLEVMISFRQQTYRLQVHEDFCAVDLNTFSLRSLLETDAERMATAAFASSHFLLNRINICVGTSNGILIKIFKQKDVDDA